MTKYVAELSEGLSGTFQSCFLVSTLAQFDPAIMFIHCLLVFVFQVLFGIRCTAVRLWSVFVTV